jgi:predicted protein tyrosine phosphatase
MQIVVLSRAFAKVFKSDESWAVISITDAGTPFPALNQANRVGLLQLEFWDTDFKRTGCFTADQALEILNFAKDMVPKIETLMIHCAAGVSRSPAVAAALYKLMGEDDSYYFERYIPNQLVYSTILEVAHEQGITPGDLLSH